MTAPQQITFAHLFNLYVNFETERLSDRNGHASANGWYSDPRISHVMSQRDFEFYFRRLSPEARLRQVETWQSTTLQN